MLLWREAQKEEEEFTSLKLKLGSLLFHIINLMVSSCPRYFVHLLTIHYKRSENKVLPNLTVVQKKLQWINTHNWM
jgi:hypothetical protein